MYQELGAPLSAAGLVSMIISAGTITSSLQSDRLTRALGAGKVTAFSVALTSLALYGFSISDQFWMLCLWAIPYGLGAGSVDAALNNYVALHYESRHMSWLHCMWGVGAAIGPYILGFSLAGGAGWHGGYFYIALIQIAISLILFLSLPLWKNRKNEQVQDADGATTGNNKAMSLAQILKLLGAKAVMICFFCYCALEATAMLWAASFFNLSKGMSAEKAASFAAMFFIGITMGQGLSGFVTMKFSDTQMIRMGMAIIGLGILVILLPLGDIPALAGLLLIGFGCAPVYPCIIHSTPDLFGADKSQAIIGVQMASAYTGTLVMPPLFGVLANNISTALFPYYMLIILALMFLMHQRLIRETVQTK